LATFDKTDQFKRDEKRLTPEEKAEVKVALGKFLEDLPSREFRPELRVKGVQSAEGVYEMSWSGEGRATFQAGEEVRPGEPHIIWRRIGGHEILDKTEARTNRATAPNGGSWT
jgi:hypothetical protein